jgi:chromosomal replication initiation ATPase DnaA
MSTPQARRQARERQLDQDRARADFAVHLVAMAFEAPHQAIWDGDRDVKVTRARHIAQYLTAVGFGLTLARVAAAFGRDRSSVAHAVSRIERLRDDPAFDACLLGLEQAVRHAPAARFP